MLRLSHSMKVKRKKVVLKKILQCPGNSKTPLYSGTDLYLPINLTMNALKVMLLEGQTYSKKIEETIELRSLLTRTLSSHPRLQR